MKVKTADLTGTALDWAVAKAEYTDRRVELNPHGGVRVENGPGSGDSYGIGWFDFRASTDWAQGGPIIEREHIGFEWMVSEWMAGQNYGGHPYKDRPDLRPIGTRFMSYGPTPLIAAMRCYVASKLGDEVDVPDELMT